MTDRKGATHVVVRFETLFLFEMMGRKSINLRGGDTDREKDSSGQSEVNHFEFMIWIEGEEIDG